MMAGSPEGFPNKVGSVGQDGLVFATLEEDKLIILIALTQSPDQAGYVLPDARPTVVDQSGINPDTHVVTVLLILASTLSMASARRLKV
jgi:hypothetical protein